MKKFIFYSFIFFSFITLKAQTVEDSTIDIDEDDSVFVFKDLTANLTDGILSVKDTKNKVVYSRTFNDPYVYVNDMDNDGNDEMIIIDYQEKNDNDYYTLYIYNTFVKFSLNDSLYSGLIAPHVVYSNEINQLIIMAGCPEADQFNLKDNENLYAPLNCYVYENGEIQGVNGELYDVFLSENDDMINYINDFAEKNGGDCNKLNKIKAAISSVYVNYITAGEKSLAIKAIENYYPCPDSKHFVEQLNKIAEGN